MFATTYLAKLEPADDGNVYVAFPDIPEALTFGEDRADAKVQAADALAVALLARAKDGTPLPPAAASPAADLTAIALPLEAALKLAVITAFADAGLSKTELARRLGRRETEARRILDPAHPTKLATLEAALAALGQRARLTVEPMEEAA
ncbi:hypothetical protein [Aurantimonas sp. 22II-16-19i]|uniref:type II toxin-antitoxin system HicB family antitoxin n=1 Tax=Aurantimonas sp. 22II-16-19i TaxID=1317114 RepID=UPI0009F7B5A6|nr:hypothetical protein [Aurantimonas sp. 22II-16-19i]ORE89763.1 putative transcriptional regulator [Aurantimonas sp. 22II-16-19i]